MIMITLINFITIQLAPEVKHFMYGKMSREIAENLCTDYGEYLLRVSPNTGGLVFTAKLKQEFIHLQIFEKSSVS